ncbi:hypothetical protein GE300_12770 [Rhodobacteraceae bacterium 2CG4]|uniref:Uncharacterized protein n=1 Tax=Halovulum marinum TaxID=2662447 RepID=A0A6L5Z1P6_9RHOB|nr:pilus assembly protein TadG-related protein [Halovulum marinum]MSU90481.1 hypothetical protein [Halovulum marinum]
MGMPASAVSRFREDIEGASTAWSIFWTLIFLIISGFVIDTANAYKYRQVLTATADAASLAAIMNYRELHYYGLYDQQDADYYTADGNAPPEGYTRARNAATGIAARIMSTAKNGEVVTDQDVELGNWNGATFTPWDGVSATPGKINAARATSYRSSRRSDPDDSNPLDTLLMGAFGGLDWWDIAAQSIAASFVPCQFTQGLVAMGKVDMSSLNSFGGEMCIHGQGEENHGNKNPPVGIDLQQNNTFGDGVTVSSNGPYDTQVAGSGKNDDDNNLRDVYQQDSIQPSGIQEFDALLDMLKNPNGADPQDIVDYMPDLIIENAMVGGSTLSDGDPDTPMTYEDKEAVKNSFPDAEWPIVDTNASGGPLTATDFEALLASAATSDSVAADIDGKIYKVDCSGGGSDKTIDLSETITLSNVAVVSDQCRISLSSNITIAASFLMTNHSGNNMTVQGSNGVTLGSGTCAEGTGSKIMARGDIDFSSEMTMIRSQIVSKEGDVKYAAKADGMNGTTVHAGGNIILTSQAAFQDCPDANPDKLIASREWYRLVQ